MEYIAHTFGRTRTRVRYTVLSMLFIAMTVNFADRSTLSIAGAALQTQKGISVAAMGYLFSAFGWAYVAAQIPGGWLSGRFGSRRIYATIILPWSLLALTQGAVGLLAVVALVSYLVIVGPTERLELTGG